jgi:hypothetical protein
VDNRLATARNCRCLPVALKPGDPLGVRMGLSYGFGVAAASGFAGAAVGWKPGDPGPSQWDFRSGYCGMSMPYSRILR